MVATAAEAQKLQIQISASTELLLRNLKTADRAIADFRKDTNNNLTRIDRDFANVGKPIALLKQRIVGLSGGAVGGLVAAAGGVSLIALAKQGLDYASSLQETAQQLGVNVEALQELRYAATQTGVEQEALDKSLAKLTLTMGKAAAGAKAPAAAFDAIGISVEALKGKTADELIPAIADGLARIGDPAQRAAIEVALFGKSGQQLDPLLSQGARGIAEFTARARELGLVLSASAIQKADEAADKLAEVKQVLAANIAQTVADNAGAILVFANALETAASSAGRFLQRMTGAVRLLQDEGIRGYLSRQGRDDQAAGDPLTYLRDVRLPALRKARASFLAARTRGSSSPRARFNLLLTGGGSAEDRDPLAAEKAAYLREQNLTRRALAEAQSVRTAEAVARAQLLTGDGDAKPFLRGGGGGGGGAGKKKAAIDPFGEINAGTASAIRALQNIDMPGLDEWKDRTSDIFRTILDEANQAAQGSRERLDDATTEIFSRPLNQYRQQLRDSVGDMDEALEGVAANGLASVEDGLLGLLDGTKTVGEAFEDLARSIIADLARIGIQSAILGLISPGAGGLGTLLTGKRAAGGPVSAGGLYLVGERGPELFAPGKSGTIIPNHSIPRLGGGGRGGAVSFDLRGAVMTQDLLGQMQRMAAATGGQALTASIDHTNRSLAGVARPRL